MPLIYHKYTISGCDQVRTESARFLSAALHSEVLQAVVELLADLVVVHVRQVVAAHGGAHQDLLEVLALRLPQLVRAVAAAARLRACSR